MSFGQNVALLGITAALTGLLVPAIKGLMDDRRFKQQKRFEAEIARSAAIIDAQVRLLEDLSDLLWEYILSVISVSYYVVNGDFERAETSMERYSDAVSDRFGRVQAELSKAMRLVSTERLDEFQALYGLLLSLDVDLLRLTREGWQAPGWSEQHRRAYEAQRPLAEALGRLATDMQLAAVEPGPASGPNIDSALLASDR